MKPDELKKVLCSEFCGGIHVHALQSSYAISSPFQDNSGDRISFYLTPSPEGYTIEDDGSYLSQLIARDIPIELGARGQMLDAILSQGGAYWDRESLEIKTAEFSSAEIPDRVIAFLSSMIRVRDLELLTREIVRSTFREDALSALVKAFSSFADLSEDEPVFSDLAEFPADVVIRPHSNITGARPGAVYFVSSNDKLSEALLLQTEAQLHSRDNDFAVIALIEEPEMKILSKRRFQRAQNRAVTMPIFRGDESAAIQMVRRRLNLPAAA